MVAHDERHEPKPCYPAEEWSTPWISRRAALSPAAPALVHEGRTYSYSTLSNRVTAAAAALDRIGAAPGDVVALLLPNRLPIVELVHAGLVADVTLLLLNTRLTGTELAFQLRDSGARFLLHAGGELSHKAEAAAAGLHHIERVEVAEEVGLGIVSAQAQCRRGPVGSLYLERTRFVLYTSGTTGRPKGVALSGSNLLASAAGSAAILGQSAGECWLLTLPIFHVGGLSILLRSVLAGSSLLLHERFDPAQVNRDLDRGGVSGISLVANMLQRILDERGGRPSPPELNCVLLGGGPAPAPLLEAAAKSRFPVAPTYGMTEAASQIATRPPAEGLGRGLCLLPGIQVRIVSDAQTGLAPGEVGEIWIRGPSVMRAYWLHPEANQEAFRDGWFRTGDLGSLDSRGALRVFDRRSDLIISGGENVYPAEVETVLLGHPSVAEAGVRGAPDDRFGARPVAWVVLAEGRPVAEESLRDHCRGHLAAYKVPVRIHATASLPRNAAGKLLRRRLGTEPHE